MPSELTLGGKDSLPGLHMGQPGPTSQCPQKGFPHTENLSTKLMGALIYQSTYFVFSGFKEIIENGHYNSNTQMSHEGHCGGQEQWALGQNKASCLDPGMDPPKATHTTLHVLTLVTEMDIYIQWRSLHGKWLKKNPVPSYPCSNTEKGSGRTPSQDYRITVGPPR